MKRLSLKACGFLSIMVCAFLPWAAPLQPWQAPTSTEDLKPIVILTERIKGSISYTIDSRLAEHPLLTLSELEAKRGQDCPVIALIDSRLPIDLIWGVDGITGKAQLTNVRYFVFNHETRMMSEIKLGRGIPFSTDPPADKIP
jgi:hypothetical protein